MHKRLQTPVVLGVVLLSVLALGLGCNSYTVHVFYPGEQRGNVFTERPEASIYVAEPIDLRPSKQRQGRGMFGTLHFPADSKLEPAAATIVRRSLIQDLYQTRIARVVENPANADYVLKSELTSMSTVLKRRTGSFAIPLLTGVAVGAIGGIGTDLEHSVKVGLVGLLLGSFIPAPAKTEGIVEVRLELRDQRTDEVLWSTVCTGSHEDRTYISLSARHDKKLAERFLPKALKRANACAVGKLYQYLELGQEPEAVVGR